MNEKLILINDIKVNQKSLENYKNQITQQKMDEQSAKVVVIK